MALPIKKIYIDTKYKTHDSISNSNFETELPMSVTFPENSVFYIDDVSIPHSWYVIEAGVNDKLYIYVSPESPDEDNSGVAYRIVTVDPGNYVGTDLATEIQTKTNAAIGNSLHPNLIAATYSAKRNNITISITNADWKFLILTPDDISTSLRGFWLGETIDTSNPQDMNEILGNLEGNSPMYYTQSPYVSNALNLQTIRNMYIHSSLGNYNTLGPRGETTIIKKVPVSADKGDMIFDQVLTGNDFGDCSKQKLRTIGFELKDSRGNYINLHGSNLSFSIVFSRMDATM
jgi:hypothetical protein